MARSSGPVTLAVTWPLSGSSLDAIVPPVVIKQIFRILPSLSYDGVEYVGQTNKSRSYLIGNKFPSFYAVLRVDGQANLPINIDCAFRSVQNGQTAPRSRIIMGNRNG
jgi:hypothetical protein